MLAPTWSADRPEPATVCEGLWFTRATGGSRVRRVRTYRRLEARKQQVPSSSLEAAAGNRFRHRQRGRALASPRAGEAAPLASTQLARDIRLASQVPGEDNAKPSVPYVSGVLRVHPRTLPRIREGSKKLVALHYCRPSCCLRSSGKTCRVRRFSLHLVP